jgi:site-specific DNA recombinase
VDDNGATRAALYARLSHENDESVAYQLDRLRDAVLRRGWCVEGEYQDDGKSGYSGVRRPGYEHLLSSVLAGKVDVVFARDTDRLFRQDKERLRFVGTCEEGGVNLVAFLFGAQRDLRDPADRRALRQEGSDAEYESDVRSSRLRARHDRKAENGEWSGGGRRPFGYDIVDASGRVNPKLARYEPRHKPYKLVVNKDEAKVLRDAAKKVLAGASLHSIVTAWNDGPRPVRKDSGSRWTITDVHRVLLSPQVAGIRVHSRRVKRKGKWVREVLGTAPGKWQGILSEAEHQLLRLKLTDPSRRPRVPAVSEQRHVLAGLVFCKACGSRMGGRVQNRKNGRRRQYVCSSANGGCSRVAITAPDLEFYVIERAYFYWEARLATESPKDSEPSEVDEGLLRELAELKTKKAGLGGLYADEVLDATQVHAATKRLNERISSIEKLMNSQLDRARTPASSWSDFYANLERDAAEWESQLRAGELPRDDSAETNLWLRSMISRVEISRARAQGVRFDRDRVAIRWA